MPPETASYYSWQSDIDYVINDLDGYVYYGGSSYLYSAASGVNSLVSEVEYAQYQASRADKKPDLLGKFMHLLE